VIMKPLQSVSMHCSLLFLSTISMIAALSPPAATQLASTEGVLRSVGNLTVNCRTADASHSHRLLRVP
jgi:hypothetical protein